MKKNLLFCFALFSVMFFSSLLLAQSAFKIQTPVLPIPQATDLTDDELLEIGIKIWQNQCGVWDHPEKVTHEMKKSITDWEENYAQIGIGQSIWYPADENKKFQEDWPHVAQALKEKGYPIEDWMLGVCPWNNREEFLADFDGDRLKALRKMLAKKALIIEQARCVAERLDASLSKIDLAIDAETGITNDEKNAVKKMIFKKFYKVATEDYPRGLYALMDYVHFKGEGVLSTETINGLGWGLRQVLEGMDPNVMIRKGSIAAFVDASIKLFPSREKNEVFKTRMGTYLDFNPDKVN